MKKLLVLTLLCAVSTVSSTCFAEGWGNLKGKIVVDGTAPTLKLLVKKGDKTVKDSDVCAANDLPDRSITVNDKGELANCFVYLYLRRGTPDIHPDLKTPKVATVTFDNKGCEFLPHAMFVRTDQKIQCISNDGCGHNVHTFPLKNQAQNFLIGANDKKGVILEYTESELLPLQIKCDIHPWMTAYWMVLDHPYCVVTDANGNFEIKNLPEGDHTFRVWHERVGYVERGLDVEIEDGKTNDVGTLKVDAKDLEG